ncbi:MAG TPA: MBL fold metallo-hydrolase [Acholeplasma sp.]|jgi:hydroxyacylglutathione hydrolase
MIITFKGNEDLSHTYILCRFNQCYLIDPSHDLESIQDRLKDKMLLGILITHAHMDHVLLIHEFQVPIYIHGDDAALLFDDKNNGFDIIKRPYKRKDLDIRIIKDQDKIQLGDEFIQVIHTPGHTKGSVSLYHPLGLFTGDTLFKDSVGRHDLYSGNLSELKKSILKLIETFPANTKVYPGHDEITTLRDERKNNPFYVKWKKQVKI